MAKRRKPDQRPSRRIPKVRLVKPNARRIQLRYFCPVEKREIRISTGTRDEQEAEVQKAELEAKLLLGVNGKPSRSKAYGPGDGLGRLSGTVSHASPVNDP